MSPLKTSSYQPQISRLSTTTMPTVIEISSAEQEISSMDDPSHSSQSLLRYAMKTPPRLRITSHSGNILDAPQDALVAHATNCLGVWGAGIAQELKSAFPTAFNEYRTICNNTSRDGIAGTCIVSPFVQKEAFRYDHFWLHTPQPKARHRRVVSLFTSIGYGERGHCGLDNPGRSSKDDILRYTRSAVRALLEWLTKQFSDKYIDFYRESTHNLPTEIWTCKFNNGRFKVPWKETEAVLREEFEHWQHVDRMHLVVVEHRSEETDKQRNGTKRRRQT